MARHEQRLFRKDHHGSREGRLVVRLTGQYCCMKLEDMLSKHVSGSRTDMGYSENEFVRTT